MYKVCRAGALLLLLLMRRDGVHSAAESGGFAALGIPLPGGRSWYVDPAGGPANSGSADEPLDLRTALSSQSPAQPGDVIWLRGGTYRGAFTSMLTGTAAAPIVVRQYPHERAIIDGHGAPDNTLIVLGSHTWFWGFEVMNSDPARVYSRRVNVDDPTSPDRVRGTGVYVHGPATRLINMVVHDAFNGFFLAERAVGAQVYGSLTYHNGVVDTARGHGHGLYIQNRFGTKRIDDVISFGNHATGMKAYGESGFAQGVHFEGVTSFANGVATLTGKPLDKMDNLFVGSTDNPADRITVRDSVFYHPAGVLASNVTLGYQNLNNGSLAVEGNLLIGGSVALTVKHWKSVAVNGNVVYAEDSYNTRSDQSLVHLLQPPGTTYRWDRNIYLDGTAGAAPFVLNTAANDFGGGNLPYKNWRDASRFDRHSQYQPGRSDEIVVRVRPNRYEPGRGHIIVLNWNTADTVGVDLAAVGLSKGDGFEVRDAQDYFGAPVLTGNYDGEASVLPLRGLSSSQPVGTTLFPFLHTAPHLVVFIVLKIPHP